MANEGVARPGSVSEVVEIIEEKEAMRRIEKDELFELHFSMGMGIWNRFEYKNRGLMESCARERRPISAEALWRRVRSEGSLV